MTLVLASNLSAPAMVLTGVAIISFIWFMKPESKY